MALCPQSWAVECPPEQAARRHRLKPCSGSRGRPRKPPLAASGARGLAAGSSTLQALSSSFRVPVAPGQQISPAWRPLEQRIEMGRKEEPKPHTITTPGCSHFWLILVSNSRVQSWQEQGTAAAASLPGFTCFQPWALSPPSASRGLP